MQTLTHASVGVFVGQMIFPFDVSGQVACLTGSIVPDIVMACQFAIDRLHKRRVLSLVPGWVLILAEISHSAILWPIICALGLCLQQYNIFWAFGLGGIIHTLIDIYTHGGKRSGVAIDLRFGWPFFDLRPEVAWDYRIDINNVVVWPLKSFELLVFISTTILSLMLIVGRV